MISHAIDMSQLEATQKLILLLSLSITWYFDILACLIVIDIDSVGAIRNNALFKGNTIQTIMQIKVNESDQTIIQMVRDYRVV